MNKILKKRILNLISHSNNNFAVNCHNTDEHEVAKLKEFLRRKRMNHDIRSEVKTKDGEFQFDLLDITEGKIIEVVHFVNIAKAKKKAEKYPKYLDVDYILI